MKLTELLCAVGDKNVTVQFLSSSFKAAKTNKKQETSITFWTNAVTTTDLMMDDGPVCLIVWADREKYKAAIAQITEATK